jgi:HEAT repeat protein
MRVRPVTIAVSVLTSTCVSHGEPAAAPLLEPTRFAPTSYHGDGQTVRMLAALLRENDPLVRAHAVAALGETTNAAAMEHIRTAAKDESENVRIASVTAAARLGGSGAAEVVRAALADDSARVAAAAAQCAGRMRLSDAADAVGPLLNHEDASVAAAAAQTLTRLGRPAPIETLAALLQGRSATVRLRAAENAVLHGPQERLAAALLERARDEAPAVRGAALAALGKLAYPNARAAIEAGKTDAAPLVRRGALLACMHAGDAQGVQEFLDDPSPLVVLAAAAAAGELRIKAATDRLFELLSDPPEDLHLAARESLRRIGGPAVAARAAAELAKLVGAPADENANAARNSQRLRDRHIRSLCWLLGRLESPAGLETQLALLKRLTARPDSDVLIDLCDSLGRVGDRRAVGPLVELLDICARNGAKSLFPGRYVPFKESITAAAVTALGRLNAAEAVDGMIALTQAQGMLGRLDACVAAAMRQMPELARPQNRSRIEQAITAVLADSQFSARAHFEAARAAGRRRIAAALPHLRRVLGEGRKDLQTMTAAAWAVQQITGQRPAIGEPKDRPAEHWIVRKAHP